MDCMHFVVRSRSTVLETFIVSTGPNSIAPIWFDQTGIVAADRPIRLNTLARHSGEPVTSMLTRRGGSISPLSQAAKVRSVTAASLCFMGERYLRLRTSATGRKRTGYLVRAKGVRRGPGRAEFGGCGGGYLRRQLSFLRVAGVYDFVPQASRILRLDPDERSAVAWYPRAKQLSVRPSPTLRSLFQVRRRTHCNLTINQMASR